MSSSRTGGKTLAAPGHAALHEIRSSLHKQAVGSGLNPVYDGRKENGGNMRGEPTSRFAQRALLAAFIVLFALMLAAWYAPYVRSELSPYTSHYDIIDPAPARIAKGRMADDYFAVEDVG